MNGPRRDRRDERGSALVELVWLGILLLVPLVWIVVLGLRGAARRVRASRRRPARRAAPSRSRPTTPTGERAAEAAARQALADQGIDGEAFGVEVTLHAVPRRLPQRHLGHHRASSSSASTCRCCPTFCGGGAPSFALDATHTVPIGQYQEITGGP